MKSSRGFTLIEVIIATTILAFISLFTARMIQQGVKSRAKIQSEIDARSGINAALQLMTMDIAKAFNYRDFNTELFNAAQKARREKKTKAPTPPPPGNPPQGQPPPPAPAPPPLSPEDEADLKPKEVKTYTRFMGEAEKIDFTSLELHRPTKNSQLSDQVEVGYYLDSCASRLKKDATSQCLWRRLSNFIDDDVKDGGRRSVVLENVKSLKFRFMGPGHEEEWSNSWLSEGGEEVMRGRFPTAVEITLVVNDMRFNPPKELGMTIVAPIEFPNNKEDQKSEIKN